MTYSNYLSAVIKVGRKVLRESEGVVALPFGSEYVVTLHNQNSLRALVRVSIDGKPLSDVADGWIIIGANDTLDLERFVRNGNFSKGNRLKFIERTAQIEEHKGIGIEDGLVRVEYKFEKIVQQYLYNNLGGYTIYGRNCDNIQGGQNLGGVANVNYAVFSTTTSGLPTSTTTTTYTSSSSSESCLRSAPESVGGPSGQSRNIQSMCMVQDSVQESFNDAGITVAGSESNQKFSWGAYFPTEDTSHVIVLKLVGKVGNDNSIPVARPITVREKPTCTTCGKVNKATFKFCGRCGTALQLVQ
jgi:hypothetical protein